MSRLILILVLAVGGVIAGLLWWSSATEPASRKQHDTALAKQAGSDATPTASNDAPVGSDLPAPTVTKVSDTATGPSVSEQIARYGYYEPLLRAEDELQYLMRDPVSRVLTPTSEKDAQWMAMRGYPRRQDIEAGDLNAMLAELKAAHPVRQAERVEYLTNTIAAKLYRANDPRWRDYANQSFGSFGVMLRLADMRDQKDLGARPDENELVNLMVHAQSLGEIDVTGLFENAGRMPRTDALDYASRLRTQIRLMEKLNRHAIRRGLKPMDFSPRPPAPWNDVYPDR